MISFKILVLVLVLLWLWLLLLENLLVTLALCCILLGEVWQSPVWEAKKVCVIDSCVCLFWKIELMWKRICDWPFE